MLIREILGEVILRRKGKVRILKAECVCLVGLLVWAAVGLVIYFLTRTGEASVVL